MAIATLAQLIDGLLPATVISHGSVAGSNQTLKWACPDFDSGWPGAPTVLSNGPAGTALTAWSNQIPMPPAVSGKNLYIAGVDGYATRYIESFVIYDRLWHSGPFQNTDNTTQTVGSVAWPTRDRNQSSDGEGVMIALTGMSTLGNIGSNGSSYTISYTNSKGVAGRTATTMAVQSGAPTDFMTFGLDVGDTGVRSVESFSYNGTAGLSSTLMLLAYRRLCMVPRSQEFPVGDSGGYQYNSVMRRDGLELGLPMVFDNSVLCWLYAAPASVIVQGLTIMWAQG